MIGRDHADYDEVRKLYNGMIDKRPLLIARCADVADVIAAVNFGRERKLAIAIRGGGHNGPGFGGVDDGLVIDLSMMRGVRVDPANRTVRVAAGCTTGDVDHEMALRILRLFVELNRLGATVLIATHDETLVARSGKPVMHLEHGEITWRMGGQPS